MSGQKEAALLHDAVRAKEQKDKEKEEKKAKGGFFGFGRTHKEHKDKHKPVQIVDATPAHPPATATHTPAPILTPTPTFFGTPPALTPIPSFVPTPAFSPSPNNSNSTSNSSNGNNNSSSIANSGKVERPDSLLASWQMSDELMQEMMTWQKQKENYERDIAPLLQAKSLEFERMCEDYLSQLGNVIAKQGFDAGIQAAMIAEERKKITNTSQQLFGGSSQQQQQQHGSLKVLEREIAARKNVIYLEQRVLRVQAKWRGIKVRKQYSKMLKNNRHRNQLVKEIEETEQVYVTNLQHMVTYLLKPLQEKAFTPQQIITQQEISVIFSNIELIANVNKELLDELHNRISLNWSARQTIGDVFLKFAPFLKLYIQYVNNYSLATAAVNHLTESNEGFSAFLTKVTTTNPYISKMGLKGISNFMILPVQRVPRYELLLRDLVKFTAEDHPDYDNLVQALSKIKDVNQRINESKRIAENAAKMIEIQHKMGLTDLIQPFRRFVKEGPIFQEKKAHGSGTSGHDTLSKGTSMTSLTGTIRSVTGLNLATASWAPVQAYLYLFSDVIIVATRRNRLTSLATDNTEQYKFKRIIKLESTTLEPLEGAGKQNGFALVVQGMGQFIFFTTKYEDCQKWIEAINKCITELQENKQTLKLDEQQQQEQQAQEQAAQPTATATLATSALTAPQQQQQQQQQQKQLDNLISLLPPVPVPDFGTPAIPTGPVFSSSVQVAGATNTSFNNNSNVAAADMVVTRFSCKLGELLPRFERVFALQNDLFQLPIELDTLIPQVTQSMPPARMIQQYERIQLLKKSVEEMMAHSDHVILALRKEKLVVEVSDFLKTGQTHIANMREWIGATFPKNVDSSSSTVIDLAANAKRVRTLMAYILEWYINLVNAWDAFLEEPLHT